MYVLVVEDFAVPGVQAWLAGYSPVGDYRWMPTGKTLSLVFWDLQDGVFAHARWNGKPGITC